MPETVQTAWPEGVIARYLTVGGATVDLTLVQREQGGYDVRGIARTRDRSRAACTGCPASEEFPHWVGVYGDIHQPDAADEKAREWAQAHAETCRAMPRPTA
jgi:hypothetical protein